MYTDEDVKGFRRIVVVDDFWLWICLEFPVNQLLHVKYFNVFYDTML